MPEMVNASSAAEILGLDKRSVLRLARAGKIRSFRTPGGQHRFRREDVENLASGNGHATEPHVPTSPLQNKREEIEGLALEVQARRAKRDLEKIEAEDAEAKRQEAEAQRAETLANERALAEARLKQSQSHEARRYESRQRAADHQRRAWQNEIVGASLTVLPHEIPSDVKSAASDALREALAPFGPGDSPQLIAVAARAAFDRALQPWQRRKEIQTAIADAERTLPWQVRSCYEPTDTQLRFRAAADVAIRELPAEADLHDICAVAGLAARKLTDEYAGEQAQEQHRRNCRTILESATWRVLPEDRDVAQQAVEKTFAQLCVGCAETQLREAADRALKPFSKRKEAAERAEAYLPHVAAYVEELGAPDGEWALGDYFERRKLAARLEKKIRPGLLAALLARRIEDSQDAQEFIEDAVDRELEIEDE